MTPRILLPAGVAGAVLASWVTLARSAAEEPLTGELARIRCANRLALALTGRTASAELFAADDPQAAIDALLADERFVEQFARFVNSELNDEPAERPVGDATYYLARHVLREGRPWHELFDGRYRVDPVPAADGEPATAVVVEDPAGLGYFRSRGWMERYAGNEPDGYRLVAAFRIQQNIIGLDVAGVDSAPDVDISATGREDGACRGCHYDAYFALDKVARILSRRQGTGADMTFVPPDEGPQDVLGTTIRDDAELVSTLVGSTEFSFRTCRLAFEYLYGRAETTCEAPLFDACVDAFTTTGDVRAALRTIAQDPGFCE